MKYNAEMIIEPLFINELRDKKPHRDGRRAFQNSAVFLQLKPNDPRRGFAYIVPYNRHIQHSVHLQ